MTNVKYNLSKTIMKSAFVTGASQGLGKGFADYLLETGWRVFAGTLKDMNDLEKKENLHWVEIDVTDDKSIERALEIIFAETKVLDLLINNAGVNKDTATNNQKDLVSSLPKLNRQLLLRMFEVNAVSPIMITKKFLRILNGDLSFVINISSCRASFHDNDEQSNYKGNYGYRASKLALNMLTFCSLYDLPKNVKTFAVHPGDVKSQMNLAGHQKPIEQAEKILHIMDNWHDEKNGRFFNYDGNFYQL